MAIESVSSWHFISIGPSNNFWVLKLTSLLHSNWMNYKEPQFQSHLEMLIETEVISSLVAAAPVWWRDCSRPVAKIYETCKVETITDLEMQKSKRSRSSPGAYDLHLGMGGQHIGRLATTGLPMVVSLISIAGCALAACLRPRRPLVLLRRLTSLSHEGWEPCTTKRGQ